MRSPASPNPSTDAASTRAKSPAGLLNVIAGLFAVGLFVLWLNNADKTPLGTTFSLVVALIPLVAGIYERRERLKRGQRRGPLAILVVGVLAVGMACVWQIAAASASPSGVAGFSGGCAPFTLWAQRVWEPYGASRYSAPYSGATKVYGFAPNETVTVDGWVSTESAPSGYTDPAPYNGPIWYHLADNSGWVYIAGVRANPSTPDQPDGGQPPVQASECAGSVR